jgi:hypothetical protein
VRRWIILLALLVMVIAAIAGWQEIKYRDEEEHTKALWCELTGTNDISSLAECIENREHRREIGECVKIEAAIDKAFGQEWERERDR